MKTIRWGIVAVRQGSSQKVVLPAELLESDRVDVLIEDESHADSETHRSETLGANSER